MLALVPLKSPAAAKSRLAGELSPSERSRLFFALAHHVIDSLARTPAIDTVAVATASAEVARFAAGHGAEVIALHGDAGMAQACDEAIAHLRPRGLSRVLMIAGDLPLVSPRALAALIEEAPQAPAVSLVPDRRRAGTNALLCAPPEAIPACFGTGSFAQHMSAARAAGAALHVIDSDALALDIDDADDLHELRRRIARGERVAPELHELLAPHAALLMP